MEGRDISFKELHLMFLEMDIKYRSVVIEVNMVVIWDTSYGCSFDTQLQTCIVWYSVLLLWDISYVFCLIDTVVYLQM